MRRRKPTIKYSNNFEHVHITFSTGESILVKREDIQKRISVDDEIKRSAYDMSKLLQTSHLPRSIMCPITRMPLCDPVICADGYSYERSELIKWLTKSKTSPITGAELSHLCLTPNHTLRNTISELI